MLRIGIATKLRSRIAAMNLSRSRIAAIATAIVAAATFITANPALLNILPAGLGIFVLALCSAVLAFTERLHGGKSKSPGFLSNYVGRPGRPFFNR
jgi:hypothetical protein